MFFIHQRIGVTRKIKRIVLMFVLTLVFCDSVDGQENRDTLNGLLLNRTFSEFGYSPVVKRKILSFKNKKILYKVNPLTYFSAGLLFVYQNVFSEQIQASCAYEISCSQFTKLSISRFGFLKGFFIGMNQLSSCFPGVADEHCAFTHTSEFKILNSVEE